MKRLMLGLVLVLVTVLATPEVASAAPTFTITPACVSPTGSTMTLTFDGKGFLDDTTVRIYDEALPNRPPILAGTNKSGDFHVQATVPAKSPGYWYYRVEDGVTVASRGISVPCGRITLDPNCGPAGGPPETYTIKVQGVSFPPAQVEQPNGVDVSFAGTQAGSGFIDFDGVFAVTITVPRRPAGTYSVSATDRREKHVAFARFNVPCPSTGTVTTGTTTPVPDTTATTAKPPPPPSFTPSCLLDPPVGPPGFVTQARCTGFPPNAVAALRWDPGLGNFSAPIGPQGTFTAPVLILPRDRLGPRTFIAESGGVSATAPFIVVPPSVAPSGSDVATQLVRRY